VVSQFLDPTSGRAEMAVEIYRYACEEYESAAIAGGMKPEVWKNSSPCRMPSDRWS
jgi:hypothetical protein